MGGGLPWMSVWLVISRPYFKSEDIVRGFIWVYKLDMLLLKKK